MKYTKDDIRFSVAKDQQSVFVYVLGMPDAKQKLEISHLIPVCDEVKGV